MSYLQIYKNKPNAYYTHSVLKGDDFYEVNLVSGQKMTWRYLGKIDPKVFQINGTLLHKPSIKTITILQRVLQPKKANESLVPGTVFRSCSQDWLKEFIDNHGYIDHGKNYISFSFDSESGGADSFGGAEITIEFDENLLLAQAHSQGLGEVEYDPYYMKQHPDIALYVLGQKTKKDYLDNLNNNEYPDKKHWGDEYWEAYIESYEHEQEIVLKKLKDEEGLIKNIVFNTTADQGLVNKLKRRNIPFKLIQGLEDDTQLNIFEGKRFLYFEDWLKEF